MDSRRGRIGTRRKAAGGSDGSSGKRHISRCSLLEWTAQPVCRSYIAIAASSWRVPKSV